MPLNTKQQQAGFTYLEVIIGVAIAGFLVATFLTTQITVKRSFNFFFNLSNATEQANNAVQQITRELRGARTGDNGAYPLENLGDQQLVFYADIDADPETERVDYYLEGMDLKRATIDPVGFPVTYPTQNEKVKVLAQNIQNGTTPLFYYYNEDWPFDTSNNPLAPGNRLNTTKIVKLYINTRAYPSKPVGGFVLSPYIQLRNLKENL